MMPLDPDRKFVQRYYIDLSGASDMNEAGFGLKDHAAGPLCLWDDVRHALDDAEGLLIDARFETMLYRIGMILANVAWVIAWLVAR